MKQPAAPQRPPRCKNCNAKFEPVRPWQMFCSDECRKQFHAQGGAFIHLKFYLDREMPKYVKKHFEAEGKLIEQQRAELKRERIELSRLAAQLAELKKSLSKIA